jgi:predicted RNA polymerase sigma factor
LPERQRLAVALRYVADLDHADIARHLGTTPAATRRLVSDALATLRREIPAAHPVNDTTNDTSNDTTNDRTERRTGVPEEDR